MWDKKLRGIKNNIVKYCEQLIHIISVILSQTKLKSLWLKLPHKPISWSIPWFNIHNIHNILVFPAYHAGLNNKMRTSVLDDWISSKTKVVVATVAFGYVFPFNFCIFLQFMLALLVVDIYCILYLKML